MLIIGLVPTLSGKVLEQHCTWIIWTSIIQGTDVYEIWLLMFSKVYIKEGVMEAGRIPEAGCCSPNFPGQINSYSVKLFPLHFFPSFFFSFRYPSFSLAFPSYFHFSPSFLSLSLLVLFFNIPISLILPGGWGRFSHWVASRGHSAGLPPVPAVTPLDGGEPYVIHSSLSHQVVFKSLAWYPDNTAVMNLGYGRFWNMWC